MRSDYQPTKSPEKYWIGRHGRKLNCNQGRSERWTQTESHSSEREEEEEEKKFMCLRNDIQDYYD